MSAACDPNCDCEPCGACLATACQGCECEPPESDALGFEGSCERCSRLVQVDERVLVYLDAVVHVKCPPGSERALA